MNGLRFEGVTRRFTGQGGARTVLQDISFAASPGEVVALMGRSGSGKSTLLNIAAGLLAPSGGRVALSGPGVLGYVFQDARLLPWLTLEGNLRLVSPPRLHARIPAWLARVGLAGRGADYPGQLSTGMAQRAALARALLIEPGVLLLDEPFAALDELTAGELRGVLTALLETLPATVLLVTHDAFEAALLADRVVLLGGQPTQVRAVVDLSVLPRPRSPDSLDVFEAAQGLLRALKAGDA